MSGLSAIKVTTGVWWVEAPAAGLRILCGCPADVVKHLIKHGLIASVEEAGIRFQTGPNAVLLSDLMVQNGAIANLSEFPVLQMLYFQGMIVPNHPGNTGRKPLIIGSRRQLDGQMNYIHRGNYGLLDEDEMMAAGASAEQARERMRLKLRFAFGHIRPPSALVDTLEIGLEPTEIRQGVNVQRLALNVFRFSLGSESVTIDLNLKRSETYECPYPLPFQRIAKDYFSVLHSGDGDGWDAHRPTTGAILLFQGRIYLVDAGPNILSTLKALGISFNEIEGIFHTHSHDDHFAGLTTLIRADRRIRHFATPQVRASVARKMMSLLGMAPSIFHHYFDCRDLVEGIWNDIDGLEVKPVFSPHPVETTLFLFRTVWEDGFRSYAHMADICRLSVLRDFIVSDPALPGISEKFFNQFSAELLTPATVKKIDVGGGMIHGSVDDFHGDTSGRLLLTHTPHPHLIVEQSRVGEVATFGEVDALIPCNYDFTRHKANQMLRGLFPGVPSHVLHLLLNCPLRTFAPGAVLAREGDSHEHLYLLLSGCLEVAYRGNPFHLTLSAGAVVGELSALQEHVWDGEYRAITPVETIEFPTSLYRAFLARSGLQTETFQFFDHRIFLQHSWLFGEVVAPDTLNRLARAMTSCWFPPDEGVKIADETLGIVARGRLHCSLEGKGEETLQPGDIFGNVEGLFPTPWPSRVTAVETSLVYFVPASQIKNIPSVRWRLFELWDRREQPLAKSTKK